MFKSQLGPNLKKYIYICIEVYIYIYIHKPLIQISDENMHIYVKDRDNEMPWII